MSRYPTVGNMIVTLSIGAKETNTKYQELLLKILLILVYIYLTWFSTFKFNRFFNFCSTYLGQIISRTN